MTFHGCYLASISYWKYYFLGVFLCWFSYSSFGLSFDYTGPISLGNSSSSGISYVWLNLTNKDFPCESNSSCVFGISSEQYSCSLITDSFKEIFTDPIPAGFKITSLSATFWGRFNCDPSQPKAAVIMQLNDLFLTYGRLPDVPVGYCNCSGCPVNTTLFSDPDIGYESYLYGHSNSFILTIVSNIICLDAINISLSYAPIEIQLISINPSKGPTKGETLVWLNGTGFTNDSDLWCRFGDVAISATFLSNSSISCHTPPNKVGLVTVQASNNGEYYSNSNLSFLYYEESPDYKSDLSQMLKTYWWVLLIGGLLILMVIVLVIVTKKIGRVNYHHKPKLGQAGSEENASLVINGHPNENSFESGHFRDQISFEEIIIGERIGRGNYGEVFKGNWRGTTVAIKKMKLPYAATGQEEGEILTDFEREAEIMRSLRHPNVVQFLGICKVNSVEVYIITEFMPLGSLNKILHDRNLSLEWGLCLRIAMDVSRGLNYLHKSDPVIIHRDLKSYNLLVDENFKVKVCDFGLAKFLNQQSGNMTSCGTPAWTAPEVLRNEHYTEKADIYSFGIVLWELITREEPHHGMSPFQVVFSVGSQGVRPTIPMSCPSDFRTLIEECWDENPDQRPSFDEIMIHLQAMSPKE